MIYFRLEPEKCCARIGDTVKRKGKFFKIIGYAYGNDGRACYVANIDDDGAYGWRAYLIPCEEVRDVFRAERLGE